MYLLVTYYICPIHLPHNHQPVRPDNYTQPKFQLYVYRYKVYSSLQLMIYFFVDLYIQNQIFFTQWMIVSEFTLGLLLFIQVQLHDANQVWFCSFGFLQRN